MKYLVLLAVLVVAYMLWRSGRQPRGGSGATPRAEGKPQDMVRCATCGVHLPRSEALGGANGLQYCSQEHRSNPGS